MVLAALAIFAACVPVSARPDPALHHVFRLNSLREPLSVVSVVMERDGGSLVVGLRDSNGKQDGCEFNCKMNRDHGPNSAFGRLYADGWLVPLGSLIQDKVARAVRRYVAGPGKNDRLAGCLLSDVAYLEKLRSAAVTDSNPQSGHLVSAKSADDLRSPRSSRRQWRWPRSGSPAGQYA